MINLLAPNYEDTPGRRRISRHYKGESEVCKHIDIAIITPYYNTGELFVDTFISVQAQSLQNWEWIIVDDGSPDNEAVERLHELVKNNPRIKVVRQVNGGTAAARNTGVANASARYICLLDHDDMIEPTYLEKCVWFLDSNTEFAFCNSYSVIFGEQNFLWTTGFERGKEYLKANSGPPISVIRKSAYEACGGSDASIRLLFEDWDFWLAMAKAGFWGYTIPEYLQWYRKLGSGRYEQILESGYNNNQFAEAMQQKYKGLDKAFPEPIRHNLKPYELIKTDSLVSNPLLENDHGRRIMFVIPWMVTGGSDKVNLDLIEGLVSKGHEVTICATLQADHQWEHQFSQLTPDIFILPNILHESDYPRFLAYLIQSRKIDSVVITGSTVGYQLLPYLRAVSPNVSFVDMCHVEEPDWLNGGHPRFSVGYQDLLDLNIVTTEHLSKWMTERGADNHRIKVMYTGVNSIEQNKLDVTRERVRGQLSIPASMPVIVFGGRLCEQKRPDLLANILKVLREKNILFHALIVGDGQLKVSFESLIKKYNINSNVQMLGAIPHEQWLDILAASDIFLMPSEYEGISVALLEAMAAGVVPVVANVGGHGEIVTNDAGVLITKSTNEINEYSNAIIDLLANIEKMKKMSTQCKYIVSSKLSRNLMIDNFLNILNEAHQNKAKQPRHPITMNFGRELASQSLEINRISQGGWGALGTLQQHDKSTANLSFALRCCLYLGGTRLGRIIVKNDFLRKIAKRVLTKITTKQ